MRRSISGYVLNITYRNEENGYTVLTIETDDEKVNCTGYFGYVGQGEYLNIIGEDDFHDTYGAQLRVKEYQIVEPTNEKAMRRYLGSGMIKGVGPALANRIVDLFGENTLHIIEDEPERLSEVKGITDKKAIDICRQVEENRDTRDVMMFLQKYGINPALANNIYNIYGDEVYNIVRTNPYLLADEVPGVGFKTADDIAKRAGIEVNASVRIKSGMCYALEQAANNGNTYLPKEQMVTSTIDLLGLRDQYMNADSSYNMDMLDECFTDMLLEQKLISRQMEKNTAVFLSKFYYTELDTARMLVELDGLSGSAFGDVDDIIEDIEKEENISLDVLQKEAVIEAYRHGVSIITGGPGTGKTTTISTIIKLFEDKDCDVVLAAPTGRAAKRMSEATGHEAKTIHRLLEVLGENTNDNEDRFAKNEQNPIEADVVIVDEMSMVDTFLIHSLLKAVTVGTRVVFVGDVDQLPSVGPGNVLRDMIDSGRFHVVCLKKVFRQGEESGIVTNAHKINRGENIELDNKNGEFLYIKREKPEDAASAVIGLIKEKLPKYVGADPFDIQVLSPTRKGVVGTENLNKGMQKYLNPPDISKNERTVNGNLLREKDKVMQTKNDYHLEWEQRDTRGVVIDSGTGVFNGDIGIITVINNATNYIEVKFDDEHYVIYDAKQAEELEPAYAVTVHKSQGSEYPAVVIPLIGVSPMLKTRNLLYTAVTRAKKCVCIVGREETFDEMVKNKDKQKRYSGLRWQLEHFDDNVES